MRTKALVTAFEWNEAIGEARAMVLRPGNGIRILREKNGQRVNLTDDAGRHRHPWFVTLRFFGGQWQFSVKPGFVNGWDPVVVGSAPKDAPEAKDLPLLEVDWIPVRGTKVAERIPPFYRKENLANSSFTDAEAAIEEAKAGDTVGQKNLRCFDIFVAVARAQLVSELQAVDGSGASGTVVIYAPRLATQELDRVGTRARLFQADQFPQPIAFTPFLRMLGLQQDEQEDRVHIASVYFLSPADVQDSEKVDQTWVPRVEQKVFWNLFHAARNEVPQTQEVLPGFISGLAGGLGDTIINQALALQRTLTDTAERIMRRSDVGGKFWN